MPGAGLQRGDARAEQRLLAVGDLAMAADGKVGKEVAHDRVVRAAHHAGLVLVEVQPDAELRETPTGTPGDGRVSATTSVPSRSNNRERSDIMWVRFRERAPSIRPRDIVPKSAAAARVRRGYVPPMQSRLLALETLLERERERLVLFLPVAMGSGVLCYHGLTREPPLWPFAAAAVVLAALGLLAVRRHVAARALCLGACAFAAGIVSAGLQTHRAAPMPALPHKATIVTGTVGAVDRLPAGGTRVTLFHPSLDGGPALARHIRIRLRPDDDAADLPDGTVLQIRALLRPPAPPAYPGARDNERDAFFSGLAGSGWALGQATVVARAARPGIATWWRGLRDRAGDCFMRGLPGSAGTIAATLMVGISSGITAPDRAAFVGSGLAHLLAVAGLHVGIVMGFAMAIVRIGIALVPALALRVPGRELAAVAALIAAGIYMMLTGAHLPIIRSFCMAALATLAIATGRRAVSMRGLSLAALVILVLWPSEIIGVSFQMSFSAVACLIAGYEVLRPVFTHLATGGHGRRFLLHLLGLATTSAIAGLASAPYAAFAFGQVQSWFVLANMAAVPLTAIWVMPWGIVSLLLMPFGLQAAGAGADGLGARRDHLDRPHRHRPPGRNLRGAADAVGGHPDAERRHRPALPAAHPAAPARRAADRRRARRSPDGGVPGSRRVGRRPPDRLSAERRPHGGGQERRVQIHGRGRSGAVGDPPRAGQALRWRLHRRRLPHHQAARRDPAGPHRGPGAGLHRRPRDRGELPPA